MTSLPIDDDARSRQSRNRNGINIITDLRFPDMQDLVDRLYFNPKEGLIWLGDKRMMLMHVEAFGALRQELLESNGVEFTRGLLTRVGYMTGQRDADLAIQARGTGNELDIAAAGGSCTPCPASSKSHRCASNSIMQRASNTVSSPGNARSKVTCISLPTASAPTLSAGWKWATAQGS